MEQSIISKIQEAWRLINIKEPYIFFLNGKDYLGLEGSDMVNPGEYNGQACLLYKESFIIRNEFIPNSECVRMLESEWKRYFDLRNWDLKLDLKPEEAGLISCTAVLSSPRHKVI